MRLGDFISATEAHSLERRLALRGGLSLGALSLLTGCGISDNDSVQRALRAVSHFNDRVQEALFGSGAALATEFPDSDIDNPFRYNAWYQPDLAPKLDAAAYKLELSGLIGQKTPWTVEKLRTLPQVTQTTRHVCVEGWSQIGKWNGPTLRSFLEAVDADLHAKYVAFECADGYYESIDMPSALHPQTLLALGLNGQTLPQRHGFPFKIKIPTKLGFKNPKFVTAIYVTNLYPGGFWPDRGYNWFSGL
jgi:DMSO/TMAO reductase YedYZ molybdopterin-dependent catalytic subunit